MNKTVQRVVDKVILVLQEFGNILTNIGVPLVATLIFAVGLIPGIPYSVLSALKLIEKYMYEAFGTSQKIRDKIEEEFK